MTETQLFWGFFCGFGAVFMLVLIFVRLGRILIQLQRLAAILADRRR